MFRFDCYTSLNDHGKLYKRLFNLISNGVMVNGIEMVSSIVYAVLRPAARPWQLTSFDYFAVIDDTDEIYKVCMKKGVSIATELVGHQPDDIVDMESWLQFLHTSGLIFASGCEYLYPSEEPIDDVILKRINPSPFNLYWRTTRITNDPFYKTLRPVTSDYDVVSDFNYRNIFYHDKQTGKLYGVSELYNHSGVAERFRGDYNLHIASKQ